MSLSDKLTSIQTRRQRSDTACGLTSAKISLSPLRKAKSIGCEPDFCRRSFRNVKHFAGASLPALISKEDHKIELVPSDADLTYD